MKVIIISPSKVFGGGEVFLIHLIKIIKSKSIILIANHEKLIKLLIPKIELKIKYSLALKIVLKKIILERKAKKNKFILNGLGECRFYGFLFSLMSIDYVVISHSLETWGKTHDNTIRHKIRTILNKLCYFRCPKIIAVCQPSYENLIMNFGRSRVILISNTAGPPRDAMLPLNCAKVGYVTFGFIGRLSSEKGIDNLIKIIDELKNKEKKLNFKILIAGDGPEKLKIINFQKNNSDLIEYLGFIDKKPFFEKIDCLIMTSETEAMPLVVLEAMRYGRSVISTKVGGVPDLVEDKINGELFQKNDTRGFSDAIIRLAIDKSVIRNYSWNSFVKYKKLNLEEKFIRTYNEIIESD